MKTSPKTLRNPVRQIRLAPLVLAACGVLGLCGAPVRAADTGLTFVQWCDPQLGMTDYKENICSLEQAVRQVNLLNPAFVVVCGDLAHKANETSFLDVRKIADSLTVPCHWAPGNHDLTLSTPGDRRARYQELFGKEDHAFSQGGFRFIVLNTQLLCAPLPGEREALFAWLEKELAGAKAAGAAPVLAGHHPPYCQRPDEPGGYQSIPPEPRQQLLGLCTQYLVRTYLSGHTHRFIENRYGDMTIVSGESTSTNMDGRPLGFRLWRSQKPQQLSSTFIPLYRRAQVHPPPPYEPTTATGAVAVCVQNLRLLDAAKEALGMQRQSPNGTLFSAADLAGVLTGGVTALACPDGGTYRINALGVDPECTHPGHRLPYFHQFEEFQKRARAQPELRAKLTWPAAP